MTSSVPTGQTDVDDWFDLDKYRQAAGVAYEFSKKKMETAGEQERETIGKGAAEQRGSAEQSKPYPLISSFSALTKTGDQANIFADLPQIANLQPALAVQASQFR